MPQSLANVLVHIIFSTKERHPFLRDAGLRDEMHHYLGGLSNRLDCPPACVGGTDDHVHILARQGRGISLSEWIKELKRESSLWVKTKGVTLATFHWQNGYGAF